MQLHFLGILVYHQKMIKFPYLDKIGWIKIINNNFSVADWFEELVNSMFRSYYFVLFQEPFCFLSPHLKLFVDFTKYSLIVFSAFPKLIDYSNLFCYEKSHLYLIFFYSFLLQTETCLSYFFILQKFYWDWSLFQNHYLLFFLWLFVFQDLYFVFVLGVYQHKVVIQKS